MYLPSPIATVASAIHHAAFIALPDIHYRKRDFAAMRGWDAEKRFEATRTNGFPEKDAVRRPDVSECEVHAMFAQTWASTALGFGGIGGAAMTPAYTVVVQGPQGQHAVYWNGSFAYLVDPSKQTAKQVKAYMGDLAERQTASRMDAVVRYGAILGSQQDD